MNPTDLPRCGIGLKSENALRNPGSRPRYTAKISMIETKILTEQEIQQQLQLLEGWTYKDNKISKQFEFNDFMDSLNFVNKLAPYCEQLDHHPDTHIFYNKILFELQRFDIGGKVTNKDFQIAEEVERLYKDFIKI